METGTIRDSVCREGLSVTFNQPRSVQAHVVNVTADPVVVGSFGGGTMNVDLLNTIALPRGTSTTSPSGLLVDASAGSAVRLTARSSNFNSVDTSMSSGTDFTFTPAGTNGSQTAPPLFVDRAGGDFHQLPTSPTIGAGLGDPVSGALDLDGAARIQGSCAGPQLIDIGAYEFAAAPCPPLVPVSGPAAGKVRLGKPKFLPGKGAVLLPVTVSAGGTVVLGGRGVVRRETVAHRAGTLSLLVKAKGRKARALRRRGKVTLRLAVTFTPFGGTAATGSQRLTLKLQRPARRASR